MSTHQVPADFTLDELLAHLRDEDRESPPGYLTAREWADRFGISLDGKYGKQIEKLRTLNLLEFATFQERNVMRLTKKGRMLGNQVFLEFI